MIQPKPGDVFHAPMYTTDRRLILGAVAAEQVDQLGCGCHRIRSTRPGPVFDGACTHVSLLTGCAFHPSNLVDPPGEDVDPYVLAVLGALHITLARSGEDVHAGNVDRLRRAVEAGIYGSSTIADRLRDMRGPTDVRLAIEKAIAQLTSTERTSDAD